MTNAAKLSELPALTGIRGFAALWVLLFHAWALSGAPPLLAHLGPFSFSLSYFCTLGWAGVDIFFTLSAFLLVLPFAAWQLGARAKPALSEYFLRRVLRIFPAYYAQLLFLIALAFCVGIGVVPNIGQFIAHLFLWLDMGWYPVGPLNGAWWTLPIEFTFYLALPLLAYALRPRRWVWLLLAAVAFTWTFRAVASQWVADLAIEARVPVVQNIPGRFDQFVLGMLGGYAFVATRLRGTVPRPAIANAQFLIALAGVFALGWWLQYALTSYWNGEPIFWVWHTCVSGFIALGLYAAAHSASSARVLFANRTLNFLGEVSFSVYLWHYPILHRLASLLEHIDSPDLRYFSLLAIATPVILLVAWLSYVLIERPFLRIGRRRALHPAQETEVPSIA